MRGWMSVGFVACLAAVPIVAAAAERLQPLSKTAESITGPIELDAAHVKLVNNRTTLKLAFAGTGVPFVGGFGIGKIQADLYRILTPRDPVLLNKNQLCGTGKPLTYLLVWHTADASGPVTTIAPSTSPTPPTGMDDVCGTYSYVPG